MKVESYTHSKSRDKSTTSDDVVLTIPDTLLAVFDGATDPTGASYDGLSSGRIASTTAAKTLHNTIAEHGSLASFDVILSDINEALQQQINYYGMRHIPSTTMAAAIFTDIGYRLLLVGDSGIRINARQLYHYEKIVDEVSAFAKIAAHQLFADKGLVDDELELAARNILYQGIDKSLYGNDLTTSEATAIIETTVNRLQGQVSQEDIIGFLKGGISEQPKYANITDHALGFATLNGGKTEGFGCHEIFLSSAEVDTIEIFSDGYFKLPQSCQITDWEQQFAIVETEDPAKIHHYPSVKGSTSKYFSDDRSVVLMDNSV